MRRDGTGNTPAILVAGTLCKREIVRFLRQKSRIIGVIGSPLLFWFLIGSGLGSSFRHPGSQNSMSYLEYFFPGTLILVLLFTAVFSTISIIEDRREGFLQSVLVAPVSRPAIALGKILGGTVMAAAQGILMLLLVPFIGMPLTPGSFLIVAAIIFTISFGLTGLGFIIAWRMESTQGVHAIMNLFLIPLWLLSGALFPSSGAAGWIGAIMRLNPLSYSLSALRYGLYMAGPTTPQEPLVFLTSLLITVVFSAAMFAASAAVVRRGDGTSY